MYEYVDNQTGKYGWVTTQGHPKEGDLVVITNNRIGMKGHVLRLMEDSNLSLNVRLTPDLTDPGGSVILFGRRSDLRALTSGDRLMVIE